MRQNSDRKSAEEKKPSDQDDFVSQPSLEVNSNYFPSRSLNLPNQYGRDIIVQQENHSRSHQIQNPFHEENTILSALQPSITTISDALLSVNTPLVRGNVWRSTVEQQTYLQRHREFNERLQYMSSAANLQYQQQISTSRHQLIDFLQSKITGCSDRIPDQATAYGNDRLPVLANQWSHTTRQALPKFSVLPTNCGDQTLMSKNRVALNYTGMTPNDAIANSKFAKKRMIDTTTTSNEKTLNKAKFKTCSWDKNEVKYNDLYHSSTTKDEANPRGVANSSDTFDMIILNNGGIQTAEWSSEVSSQTTPSVIIHKKRRIEFPSESGEDYLIESGKAGGEISRFGYNSGELVSLSVETDEDYLSEFQCFLRKQICYFEASELDLQCSAQGRNTPISLGQVGLVCRHCAVLPPGLRQAASAYFPTKFDRVYQASQNLCTNHLMRRCGQIPESIRSRLLELKGKKSTTRGGGKKYWVNGAKKKGIVQTEISLRFSRQQPVDK